MCAIALFCCSLCKGNLFFQPRLCRKLGHRQGLFILDLTMCLKIEVKKILESTPVNKVLASALDAGTTADKRLLGPRLSTCCTKIHLATAIEHHLLRSTWCVKWCVLHRRCILLRVHKFLACSFLTIWHRTFTRTIEDNYCNNARQNFHWTQGSKSSCIQALLHCYSVSIARFLSCSVFVFLQFLAWVLVQLECLCDLWPTCFLSYTSMLQLTSYGYHVSINPSKSFYWTNVHLIEEKHIAMKLQRNLHDNNFKQTLQ